MQGVRNPLCSIQRRRVHQGTAGSRAAARALHRAWRRSRAGRKEAWLFQLRTQASSLGPRSHKVAQAVVRLVAVSTARAGMGMVTKPVCDSITHWAGSV